ncbi:MAG: hypothetical protein IKN58_01450 [Prevotella sp.]|nr:hypothetical protein [Prevotella sp.]
MGAMLKQWQQIDENAKNGAKNAEFFVCFQQKYRLFSAEIPLVSAEIPLVSAEMPLIWAEMPLINEEVPLINAEVPQHRLSYNFDALCCFLLCKTLFSPMENDVLSYLLHAISLVLSFGRFGLHKYNKH